MFFPLALLIPLMFYGAEWLKKRLTYPRTGYVLPRMHPFSKAAVFLAFWLGGFVLTLFYALLGPEVREAVGTAFQGTLAAVVLLIIGFGLRRFTYLAVAAALLGWGLTVLPGDADLEMAVFCRVLGTLLLVSGALTLRCYLRRNPLDAP